MKIEYTLQGTITVPDGSQFQDHSRAIILPDGQWIKLFTAVELNDDRDISFHQQIALDIDLFDQYCKLIE